MIRPASLLLAISSLALAALPAPAQTPAKIDFNRDVRPILADHCFACHGPDSAHRKADLRLDTPEGALADKGEYHIILPGKPEQSELFLRVSSDDDLERMPPAKTGKKLTPQQTDTLRLWIAQGARWEQHWALVPPRSPALPSVKDPSWVRNPIDAFVLARLEREGLAPSPEADRATLLRRVTLDLTGLPATPEEIDAFVEDKSPDAYERAVDRLLASPAYGERMARAWLDAARYADTNGYQSDGWRTMWRWRDWVLAAYNANRPFDDFTVEQVAGDLLPRPTLDQRIATGFNRNHRGNGEGGVIAEEYAVEYVVDRVDTTATVWLGLTLGCARCHDHKYDPFTQKEFYRLFAFFNNVPENGKAVKFGNSPPMIPAPTPEQQERLRGLDAQLRAAEARWDELRPRVEPARREWEEKFRHKVKAPKDWSPARGLVGHFPLDAELPDKGKFAGSGPAWTTGRVGGAAEFDGARWVEAGDVGDFGFLDKFTLSAWVYPEGSKGGTILSRMTDEEQADGYAVVLAGGKVQVNLVKRWLDDALRVESERPLEPGRWHHVLVRYDGSRVASGVRLFLDGQKAKLRVLLDELNQSFNTKQPLRIGGGNGPSGRFHGRIDDVRIYRDALTPEEVAVVATPEPIASILEIPEPKRSAMQAGKLQAYFLERHAPAEIRSARENLLELSRRREALVESFPTTMVMEELPRPRDTHVLERGQYDRPGEKVTAGVPAALPPLPAGEPANRLGLARWLVHPDNPLTARVAVNRDWQAYFGTGLVKTAEDFGTQGEPPSHPELLDWLATEFVRSGWDVKRMQRLIVTSATYRQSSRVRAELLAKDPDNRLLARGPRFRLSAEVIRDQALAAGGLLVRRVGGPSVKPYQPAGLWEEVSGEKYQPDSGEALYRRSLYTFWKRTVSPPTMAAFDAPARETCTVRRSRTNTPLQALALLNDVTFVEAARALAARALREPGPGEEALTRMFRLAAGRPPREAELRILARSYARHREHYRADRAAAEKFVRVGASPPDPAIDVGELAAATAAASVLLNLDEVLNKE